MHRGANLLLEGALLAEHEDGSGAGGTRTPTAPTPARRRSPAPSTRSWRARRLLLHRHHVRTLCVSLSPPGRIDMVRLEGGEHLFRVSRSIVDQVRCPQLDHVLSSEAAEDARLQRLVISRHHRSDELRLIMIGMVALAGCDSVVVPGLDESGSSTSSDETTTASAVGPSRPRRRRPRPRPRRPAPVDHGGSRVEHDGRGHHDPRSTRWNFEWNLEWNLE